MEHYVFVCVYTRNYYMCMCKPLTAVVPSSLACVDLTGNARQGISVGLVISYALSKPHLATLNMTSHHIDEHEIEHSFHTALVSCFLLSLVLLFL